MHLTTAYPGFTFNCFTRISRALKVIVLYILVQLFVYSVQAQSNMPGNYNVTWHTQSNNASASMPCGGGSIGTNVWVENGELFLYLSQSGAFDENNTLLKAGRVRVQLNPNPFAGGSFTQQLNLYDGHVSISGSNGKLQATVNLWVDVFNPVVHIDVQSNKAIKATATFESWRYKDRQTLGKENTANSWKWAKDVKVFTRKDSIGFSGNNSVVFFHQNTDSTVFDATVRGEGLQSIKDSLHNPLKGLQSGGILYGKNMVAAGTSTGKYLDTDFKGWQLTSSKAAKQHNIQVLLAITPGGQPAPDYTALRNNATKNITANRSQTLNWWHNYWQRSFVYVQPQHTDTTAATWQMGRNYQLMRYMLGCNAYGSYPTKFNGGLFTYDPIFTDTTLHGTPDHRNWGGGIFTAQNQRLVYWPMLKSGDVDLMHSQFNLYKQALHNAIQRTRFYWNHNGACFTEQMEFFGLPNLTEYGLKRPANADKGVEYNAWLEYEWDTVLEFCQMMLDAEAYQHINISEYLPIIENCLIFFDEHYQYLAKQRGSKALNGNGKLVLYPGSGGETYKMAYNATSTIAALQKVTESLLKSPALPAERKNYYLSLLNRIPPMSYGSYNGKTTIAPAQLWERVNNTEPTQLYPVFPWGLFGIGRPGLDTAINTYLYDTFALKFRSHVGWKQDNIFAARLGLTDEALRLNTLKLQNSGRRFPAFWGPGFDWVPDHNWGGSGMIGLQEMLLQTVGDTLYLFPAWPKTLDVHFKLHAPHNTTVEAKLQNGRITLLDVQPAERAKDIINLLK